MSANGSSFRTGAAHALWRNERLLRLASGELEVGITHAAPDGRFLRVNREFCDMTGYSAEELAAMSFHDITFAADLARDMARAQRLLAGELDGYSIDKRYVHKNHSLVWAAITVSLARDRDGKPQYFIAVIEPIGDRRLLGDGESLSPSRHRALLESVAEAMFVAQDGRLVFANLAFPAMLGYAHAELLEAPFEDYVAPDSLRRWHEALSRPGPRDTARADPVVLQFVPRVQAGPVWLELRVTSTQFDGQPAALGVLRDVTERKQAEQTARERAALERQLATVAAATPGIIHSFRRRPDGSISFPYINHAAADLFGVRHEDLVKDATVVRDLMPAEDRERVAALVAASARDMTPLHFEYRIRPAAGGERWVETHSIPIREDDGSVIWHGFLHEITERKRVEGELLHYAAIVESSRDAIIGKTIDGIVTSWNAAAERMFGYTAAEMLGRSIGIIVPADRREEVQMIVASISRGKAVRHLETVRKRKDGTLIDVSITISPLRDGQGRIVGGSAIARDITESKRAAQRALLQAEEMLDSARDAIIIRDDTGTILYWNEGAERLYGWKAEEAAGKVIHQLLHTVFPQPLADIESVHRATGHWEGELEHRRRDGSSVTVLSRWTVQPGDSGRGGRLLEINTDITARKRAEMEIEALNEHLRARSAELEAYTYSVSHDLKAPLRGIDGYSRLLLQDHLERLDQEGRFFLQAIRKATGRMEELIDDLLAYSRVDRAEISVGRVELLPLIEALFDERSGDTSAAGAEVTLDVQCRAVAAESEGLALVLRNLIDNALKFSRDARPPRIEAGSRLVDGRCVLWVRDNGIGFDMQFHDKIFDIFHRLHPQDRYPGTGIGLAIVRKAIERMRGRVWAEASPGGGATFYVELPVEPRAATPRLDRR